ncbi:T9SS type B sorting domain-containing protein [Aquimarina macrocephali]|uniref:T9SS type B sorting domain-containing protein n=1 Tax=Aquimarina macrocephali TaxID=666563 RepID=UPI00054D6248|nr:gliding motility-associated C-terminal domain-containing protein [Aquimarina macrocephali]
MRNNIAQDIDKLKFYMVIYIVFGNFFLSIAQVNAPYECPEIPLSYINGTNGFTLEGISEDDEAGFDVSSAGDINGDGIDDLLISAYLVDDVEQDVGEVYIVFGKTAPFDLAFELSTLDGSNGFTIRGESRLGKLGTSLAAIKDFNNDSIDDIIIGEPGNDSVYVLFGRSIFPALIRTSDISGSTGFRLRSSDNVTFGSNINTAGDINNDGIDDIIIYSENRDNTLALAGKVYLVFGSSSFPNVLDVATLTGTDGFVINKSSSGTLLRQRKGVVNTAGDLNGDDIDDIIVGFPDFSNGTENTGLAFVIFGRDTIFPSSLEFSDLDGTNGFEIIGEADSDRFGYSVAYAGDVNDDGIDDVIIGAYLAEVDTFSSAGKAYVLFGKTTGYASSMSISSLDGNNGFTILGDEAFGNVGHSVSTAGDYDGDNIDDIIIGAYGVRSGGAAYVVYGKNTSWNPVFETNLIDGVNGIEIFDNQRFSRQGFGHAVSVAGDVNGDGATDLIIGAISQTIFSYNLTGRGYVIYGGTLNGSIDFTPPTIACPGNQTLAPDVTLPEYIQPLFENITDSCQPNNSLTITQIPPRGTPVSDGMLVTISATDRRGNTTNCEFTIILQDIAEPPCSGPLDVSEISGLNGFTLSSPYVVDGPRGQTFVSGAGDINNDGRDDFIVCIRDNEPSVFDINSFRLENDQSEAYVIYGTDDPFPSTFDLLFLVESQGFKITKQPSSANGRANEFFLVDAVGDFNNDNIDDLIIGDSGSLYLIYGINGNFPFTFDIANLDGTNGFEISANNFSAIDVSAAGDLNNDNIDDVLISGRLSGVRKVFAVFGNPTTGVPPSFFNLNSLDGTNGFFMNEENTIDQFGINISGAGDLNGDNFDDIIIGAPYAEPNGIRREGQVYVVFSPGVTASSEVDISTLDGTNGFIINAVGPGGRLGASVTGGIDINNDNMKDIIVTAPEASFDVDGRSIHGAIYAIFGTPSGYPAAFDLNTIDGTNGAIIYGRQFIGQAGYSSSTAGDFNNDGIDDLILGGPWGRGGDAYIVFGKENWEDTLFLDNLDGFNGLNIGNNFDISDHHIGASVSNIGDFNGDGFDDVIVGEIPDVFDQVIGNTHIIFGGFSKDTEAPRITTCPGDQTLSSGSPLPDYTGDVVATDDCDTNLEITQAPVAGTLFTADTTVTITVTDNSGKETQCSFEVRTPISTPTVNLSVSANAGTEAAGTVITVTATSSGAVVGAQTIDLATTGVGITASDFTLSNTTVTIPDGMTTGTVTFTIVDDALVEGTETATLTISNPSTGISLGTTTTQDIDITDNDSIPTSTVNLSVSANAGTEAAGTVITVTATSSGAVVGAQTIDLATTGVGITASDFTLSNTTITIPDGMTTGTVTFTIVDDALVEGTETATLTISNPSTGITLGTTTTQDVVITDNDSAPISTVSLSVSANAGTEAAGTVITVTATSSIAVVGAQTIDIAATGVGITASDFTLSNTTVTIPDGMTAGIVTFTIVDDALVEGTETATLTISNPSTGITLGTTTAQDVVITDNDSAPIPTVSLSVSANAGTEAAGTIITVTATSSIAVVGAQTIDLATTGVGITASDFTLSNTTVTIPDGMTTGTVTFTIVDDALVEGTETATLTISNPSTGISLGTTTAQDVVIEDNDDLVICTIEAGEDQEIIQGQEVQLNATTSDNGTFVWTPSTGLTNTNIANPVANPNQTTTYTVLFTSDLGCIEEDTVTVYVEAQEEDQTRYGFSPDGDGINEYWEIYNIENYPDNKVSIYNRWGDIVFEVDGYNNTSRVFRGIANRKRSLGGDKLPEGTYFFTIKIEGSHNLKKQTGFLVLKR